jgi:hypothetical protein
MKNGKLKGKDFFAVEHHLVVGCKSTKAADSSERA